MAKLKLISQGPGHYETEDGRGMIYLDSTYETECEIGQPHPVKIRLDSMEGWADWYKKALMARGKIKTKRTKEGWVDYLTYQCEGGESHFYSMWTVKVDEEWTPEVYEHFSSAREALEAELGPTTLVRKPKKAAEREVVLDETGRASWAKCGHPAELDIDENCYVCHEKP